MPGLGRLNSKAVFLHHRTRKPSTILSQKWAHKFVDRPPLNKGDKSELLCMLALFIAVLMHPPNNPPKQSTFPQ